jgi:hypothetical protein
MEYKSNLWEPNTNVPKKKWELHLNRLGEAAKTKSEVSISILKCLKLNIYHAYMYFTQKMPDRQNKDSYSPLAEILNFIQPSVGCLTKTTEAKTRKHFPLKTLLLWPWHFRIWWGQYVEYCYHQSFHIFTRFRHHWNSILVKSGTKHPLPIRHLQFHFDIISSVPSCSTVHSTLIADVLSFKATLYSMQPFRGWWHQCPRSKFKAASTHCWRQRHSVTALATYAMTLVTAWMPWRRSASDSEHKHSAGLNTVWL